MATVRGRPAPRCLTGKKTRSRRLTVPRLELVAVVEVDGSGASPGKVSAREGLGGHCNGDSSERLRDSKKRTSEGRRKWALWFAYSFGDGLMLLPVSL